MHGFSQAVLSADITLEKELTDELCKLKEISEKLPYRVKVLLDGQKIIDGSMYYNGFFDYLGIVIPYETSIKTQVELQGIKNVIEKILNS